ncbi:hypothetical protein HY745_01605 [Candidatus Desantisbacteria bacterium]|nr:hypothetical protein [Candidatus Desantisbacteria bacterium]
MYQNDKISIGNEEIKIFIKDIAILKNKSEECFKKFVNFMSDIHIYSKIIESTKEAVISTLTPSCGTQPEYHGIIKKEPDIIASSIIGICSIMNEPDCSILLGFPSNFAIEAARKFGKVEIDFDSDCMHYFVSEMSNILAADIVARMDNNSIKGKISLPKSMKGTELIASPYSDHLMYLSFSLSQKKFWLGIQIL